MRVNNNGNIGIGTTSPNAKLDATGYIRVNGNAANIDPAISTVGNLSSLAGTGQMLMGWNRTAGADEALEETKSGLQTATGTLQ